jgi:metal-dependent amidase/aminoacylase/carboxypeptidase family protein
MPNIKSKSAELASRVIGFRRDLHQIPEAGMAEYKTSAFCQFLITCWETWSLSFSRQKKAQVEHSP